MCDQIHWRPGPITEQGKHACEDQHDGQDDRDSSLQHVSRSRVATRRLAESVVPGALRLLRAYGQIRESMLRRTIVTFVEKIAAGELSQK